MSEKNLLPTTTYSLQPTHVPVLLHEVIEGLNPKLGETILDGTLGGGGHAEAFLKAIGAKGTLIGFDADEDAIVRVKKFLSQDKGKIILVHDNFRNLKHHHRHRPIARCNRRAQALPLSGKIYSR